MDSIYTNAETISVGIYMKRMHIRSIRESRSGCGGGAN